MEDHKADEVSVRGFVRVFVMVPIALGEQPEVGAPQLCSDPMSKRKDSRW